MCITRQDRKKSELLNTHELLSHDSNKTIDINTYTSTKSIQQIKNPFDDL
jgi:integrase/recombinase XerD